MAAGRIIKTLKGAVAVVRLGGGEVTLDQLDAAMDGTRSAGDLLRSLGNRAPAGPEALLAAALTKAVAEGGDPHDRLVLLDQMVALSLPRPREIAALGLNPPAIVAAMQARLRQLFIGSTTLELMRSCQVPVLVFP